MTDALDAAVEAAAKEYTAYYADLAWGDTTEAYKQWAREYVRPLVEAAAPYLWDEGADAAWNAEPGYPVPPNPYPDRIEGDNV